MAELDDGRSLGQALVSATSTFFLFVATSIPSVSSTFRWNRRDCIRYLCELVFWLASVAFDPVSCFAQAAVGVVLVCKLLQTCKIEWWRRELLHSVATMALCPTFIELQPAAESSFSGVEAAADSQPQPPLRNYHPEDWKDAESIDKERVYSRDHIESLDPLELCFESKDQRAMADRNADNYLYFQLYSPHWAFSDLMDVCSTAVKLLRKELIAVLQRQPRTPILQFTAAIVNRVYQSQSAGAVFHERRALLHALKDALLEDTAAAPAKSVIRKLEFAHDKDRSMWPNVLRLLQGFGYMWSALERMVQREALSPMEVILSFLSLLVSIQVFMELFVRARYSRMLVLRLSPQQYTQFFTARKEADTSRPLFFPIVHAAIVVMLCLISGPFVYYAFSFRHRGCHDCYTSTLLFFLSAVASSVLTLAVNLCWFAVRPGSHHVFLVVSVLAVLLQETVQTMPLTGLQHALQASIRHWKLFSTKTNNIFHSWVIPHVVAS